MPDPLTTPEAAYEESVTKADEARVEQHWREAEQAAETRLDMARAITADDIQTVIRVLECVRDETDTRDDFRILRDFRETYGDAALVTVIARALEVK